MYNIVLNVSKLYEMRHSYVCLDVAFCKIIGSKVICCTIDVGECTYKFSDHVFDTKQNAMYIFNLACVYIKKIYSNIRSFSLHHRNNPFIHRILME